jgi:FHS family glucose/mannose:H+ symporter-like MFS transporter
LSRSPVAIILCAGVIGLALGPIYPLLLAKALTLMKDSPDAKWVFSISGLGAAVLPWVTGKISAHNGSLRIGLLVPVVALATMMTLNRLRAFPEVQYGGHN